MKVLKKKLKKVHIAKKIFYNLISILYLACLIYFIIGILKLKGIENLIRSIIISIFCVWFLIYLLGGLITMIAKKNKSFVFLIIITFILCPVLAGSSYYINKVYGEISNINSNTIKYTTNLIALKETNFTSSLAIGMVDAEDDIEGNILAKKLIKNENLTNEIYYYEDYHSMINDLYKGKIGGCFVSSNYEIIFEDETFNEENTTSIAKRVKVLYEYSEERENQDVVTLTNSKNKKLTEPFTALIMGVDSAKDGLNANQAFNGDTLIMVTFNPNTLSATMFSIPRDLYVPIACNNNRYAKINSSAAYGSSCVINTIQQLTGIDIDYYVKINFTGVVQLVDALGGVTVDVEKPDYTFNNGINCQGMICEQNSKRQFGSEIVYIPTGIQRLDGEQALAYARNRHQWAISDIARNQHQQQIIESMANELKSINSITEFEKILTTVSNNIETNMTPEQILSFYSVGKDMLLNTTSNSLSIKKTYLSYYNLSVYIPRQGRTTSALGYYPESLEAIIKLMKVNLGQETEQPIKTFSISYNEDYTTPIVGRGLTGGTKLALVKSFIGLTEYEAMVWCQENNISCTFETTTDYNTAGLIVDQSAHEGELLKSINSITFYISDGLGINPDDIIEPPNENEGTENPTNPEPEKPDNNEGENNNSGSENNPPEEPIIPGTPSIDIPSNEEQDITN